MNTEAKINATVKKYPTMSTNTATDIDTSTIVLKFSKTLLFPVQTFGIIRKYGTEWAGYPTTIPEFRKVFTALDCGLKYGLLAGSSTVICIEIITYVIWFLYTKYI